MEKGLAISDYWEINALQLCPSELEHRGATQLVTFPHLAVPHASSTRLGGQSQGPYASLNLGRMSGDQLEVVERNREQFGNWLGFPIHQNLQMDHGVEVAHLEHPSQLQQSWPADACITAHPEVTLSLTTADCVPLFFHDAEAGAVGLAHAGWRGTVAGIAARTVQAMVERLGARPERIRVGLGPSIGPCCFEVGPDVADRFEQQFGARSWIHRPQQGQPRIDLHRANLEWLLRQGIDPDRVRACSLCTSCRSDLFFSYRRDRGTTGRMLSAISLQLSDERG